MKDFIQESVFFGVFISLCTYEIGLLLKKKVNFPLFNPLLISIAATIVFLVGFDIDYATYEEGAKYLSYFLAPSTVCLAIPLHQQFEKLKKNWVAILSGILAGCLTSAICVFLFAVVFSYEHKEYVSLLPKSITTAIGMGVSEELNGYVTISVAVIVVTGILGNVIAEMIYKIFHITEPIAKGVALGTSAHAMGTAKALEIGEIEGAMSGLSIAVSGVITVVLAPFFATLI